MHHDLRNVLAHGGRWFFNPEARRSREPWGLFHLRRIAARYNVPVLQPPERDINHPGFIRQLREELRPTLAFSCFSTQIFGTGLLALFLAAVNYHNGLLPHYRGLAATGWSMYRNESETGYTFHTMNQKIDEGPILLQGTIPIGPGDTARKLEFEKTFDACGKIDILLDRLSRGDTGVEQKGEATYFGRKDYLDMVEIPEPSALAASDLFQRLRSFQVLNIRFGARSYPVTGLTRIDKNRKQDQGLFFRTSDGITLAPKRLLFLPNSLYRLSRLPFQ